MPPNQSIKRKRSLSGKDSNPFKLKRSAKVGIGRQTKALNAAVMKVVNKHRELKQAQYTVDSNLNAISGTSWGNLGVQALSPYGGYTAIAQGTGQGDRIGNRIEIVKSRMTITTCPLPYNVTTNPTPQPQYVFIWLLQVKNSVAVPTNMNNFFQSGDSSVSGAGTWVDGQREMNSDLVVLKKQLVLKSGYAAAVGTGFQAGPQDFANNDFNLNNDLTIDITPFMPKRIVFNDTGTTPESNTLWLIMETVNADGTSQAAALLPTHYVLTVSTQFRDD